ncbi:MAG: copper homeostasis periplasmic binding protein CopC [Proteobacteria bacterium]|nr:copper homeostasis periplasmic binding protein CopC [Pseudomonadota bacterium]
MKRLMLAALVTLSLTSGGLAYAHPELEKTTPAANATVPSPAKIELRFSERLAGEFSGADLLMLDMPGMKMDKPSKESAASALSADGMTLTLTPSRPLMAGTYRVDYHVVSTDTHRITGSYSFKVQ